MLSKASSQSAVVGKNNEAGGIGKWTRLFLFGRLFRRQMEIYRSAAEKALAGYPAHIRMCAGRARGGGDVDTRKQQMDAWSADDGWGAASKERKLWP